MLCMNEAVEVGKKEMFVLDDTFLKSNVSQCDLSLPGPRYFVFCRRLFDLTLLKIEVKPLVTIGMNTIVLFCE